MDLKKRKKISIVGPCGSGKSFLAKELGRILNLPIHHIDCYFWQPGWVGLDRQLLVERIKEITDGDEWVIDGTYTRTFEDRFERSDVIIFLNFPIDFCIESVKGRHGKKRTCLPEYLEEREDGIEELIWHANRFPEKMKEFAHLFEKYKCKIVEYNSREQVNEMLDSLK